MLKPHINDWEDYKKYFNNRLAEVKIPSEIAPHEIKHITSVLNDIYDEVFFDFAHYKSLYENVDDLIDEIRSRNLVGSNSEHRRKNGYDAAGEFQKSDGERVNLFELRRRYRERFNFLKAIMDSVQSKKSSLIVDSAALKIEASLLGG
jgi:hypothetical protein